MLHSSFKIELYTFLPPLSHLTSLDLVHGHDDLSLIYPVLGQSSKSINLWARLQFCTGMHLVLNTSCVCAVCSIHISVIMFDHCSWVRVVIFNGMVQEATYIKEEEFSLLQWSLCNLALSALFSDFVISFLCGVQCI